MKPLKDYLTDVNEEVTRWAIIYSYSYYNSYEVKGISFEGFYTSRDDAIKDLHKFSRQIELKGGHYMPYVKGGGFAYMIYGRIKSGVVCGNVEVVESTKLKKIVTVIPPEFKHLFK